MKILFLSSANSTHTIKWVNALSKKDCEVHLVYIANHSPDINNISDNITLHKLKFQGYKGYFLNVFELKKIFTQIKPDIVNAHYASGYGTLARLAKLKPLILSVWGSDVYDFPYRNKFNRWLIKKNLLYANKISSTSYCMSQQVKNLLPNYSKDISVIPFGVDVNLFKKYTTSKKNNKFIICNIKTLSNNYGIDVLINSFDLLLTNLKKDGKFDLIKNLELHIYGDGPQKTDLKKMIHSLKLDKFIFLKGKVENSKIPTILNDVNIFCCTSNKESFGVAIVEAMACEVAVLATDAEGFKEIIQNGVNGLIVEKGNIFEIEKGLRILINNAQLRYDISKSGRDRVLKLYNWDENVELMLKIYKTLI